VRPPPPKSSQWCGGGGLCGRGTWCCPWIATAAAAAAARRQITLRWPLLSVGVHSVTHMILLATCTQAQSQNTGTRLAAGVLGCATRTTPRRSRSPGLPHAQAAVVRLLFLIAYTLQVPQMLRVLPSIPTPHSVQRPAPNQSGGMCRRTCLHAQTRALQQPGSQADVCCCCWPHPQRSERASTQQCDRDTPAPQRAASPCVQPVLHNLLR
jgi:hypothetical protein